MCIRDRRSAFRHATGQRERAGGATSTVVQHAGVKGVEPAGDPDRLEKGRRVGQPGGRNGPGTKAEPLRRLDLPDQSTATSLAPGAMEQRFSVVSALPRPQKNRARIAPVHGFF